MTSFDPLDFFPYEVFSRIIQFACYDDRNGPLLLLTTSPRWETTIIETPEVWSHITIDDKYHNDEDIIDRALVFLHLSRNVPIDLRIIHLTTSKPVDILKFVLKESRRIFSLSITAAYGGSTLRLLDSVTFPGHDLIFGRRDGNFTFPILEEITLGKLTSSPKNLLKACPKLRHISGGRITIDDIPSLSSSTKELEFSFKRSSELDKLHEISKGKFTSLKLLNTKKKIGHETLISLHNLWIVIRNI